MSFSIPPTESASWRPLYEWLRTAEYGTTVKYDDLDDYCKGDSRLNRWPIYRTIRELQRNDNRTLESVRNVGYRVAEPEDHLRLAHVHRRRGKRQIHAARIIVSATDFSRIQDPEARRQLENFGTRMSRLEQQMAYYEERQNATDRLLAEEASRSRQADEKLNERLQRLEQMFLDTDTSTDQRDSVGRG